MFSFFIQNTKLYKLSEISKQTKKETTVKMETEKHLCTENRRKKKKEAQFRPEPPTLICIKVIHNSLGELHKPETNFPVAISAIEAQSLAAAAQRRVSETRAAAGSQTKCRRPSVCSTAASASHRYADSS